MNRKQGISLVVFLVISYLSTFSFAGAQTVRKPTTDPQTVQQPKPSTQIKPTKTDVRTSPMRPKGPITSTAANHCVNDLYMDIKGTYNRLSSLCTFIPTPSFQAYSSLRDRLNFLNLDWRRSNCQAQAILETIKNEVHAIYSSRIAEATSKCMKSCLNVVDVQVAAASFDTAPSECRNCCDFLPQESNTECQIKCSQALKQEQLAGQMADEAKRNAEDVKERWKEALRLLQEMADRQTEVVRTMTD